MANRELLQHYALEILARARTVEHKSGGLLDEEFFSDAPHVLAKTIRNASRYLAEATLEIVKNIDWDHADASEIANELRLLQTTDGLVKELAEQIRYVEAAHTEKLPWSIVPSFEQLVSEFVPEIQIMLRAMSRYNYAFHMSDQRELYRTALEPFKYLVTETRLEEDVLKEMTLPFHIISFPSLERKHILLHSLLGHEIGHLIVGRFLTADREAAFVNKVKPEIVAIATSDLPTGLDPAIVKSIRERRIAAFLSEALALWTRALEELLSDTAAVVLFGPAALFSLLDLAIQNPMDEMPQKGTNYYPPWRMRLRHAKAVLASDADWFPVPSSLFGGDKSRSDLVNSRLDHIDQLIKDNSDRDELAHDKIATVAYREAQNLLPLGLKFMLDDGNLSSRKPVPSEVYSRIPALILRLDHRIPPNAFEESLDDDQVASFAEILNATWLHKLSTPLFAPDGQPHRDAVDARNLVNNLTLKAIEYSHLSREYRKWQAADKTKVTPAPGF